MSDHSKIEWTDATWNPLRGCTKISPGCKHCYAETFAERFRGVPGHPYERGFDLRLIPAKLAEPFQWSGPRAVFVNSMSDLFQPGVPDEYIEAVTQVTIEANWHTYQVLTKRADRLRELLSTKLRHAAGQRHIWWGVSVEDRKYGLPRIADLRKAPAAMRFLSIEPLLEDLGEIDLSGIVWAIVGGEITCSLLNGTSPGDAPQMKQRSPSAISSTKVRVLKYSVFPDESTISTSSGPCSNRSPSVIPQHSTERQGVSRAALYSRNYQLQGCVESFFAHIRTDNFLFRVLKKAGKAAGIKGVNHQMLRRTCSTYMAQLSTVKDVQAHLRHANASTTLEHYIKSVPASVRIAVESLDHMLKSIPSGQQEAAS